MNWKVTVSVVGLILLTRLVSAAPPLVDAAKKVRDASKWTGRPVYLWLSERKVISWQAPPRVADHHIPRTPFKGVAAAALPPVPWVAAQKAWIAARSFASRSGSLCTTTFGGALGSLGTLFTCFGRSCCQDPALGRG